MAIRNALKGGTDFSDGEVLYDYDLDDTFNAFYTKVFADNTGGTTNTATTETDLVSLTIPAGTFGISFSIVIASFIRTEQQGNSGTTTFKLYIDGIVEKTISFADAGNSTLRTKGINFFKEGLDNTSDVIVKVSVQETASNVASSMACDNLIITGVENNS